MQVIIYPNETGGVSVVYPAPTYQGSMADLATRTVPEGAAWRVIDTADLPDTAARDRWTWTTAGALGVAEAVPVVPDTIRKVQFVRAMRSMGLWDTHRETIEAHPDWPYITEIPRDDHLTLTAAAAMGATPEQMDAIWILGATL